jgi:hypothetical protein
MRSGSPHYLRTAFGLGVLGLVVSLYVAYEPSPSQSAGPAISGKNGGAPAPAASGPQPADSAKIIAHARDLLARMTAANRPKRPKEALKQPLIERSEVEHTKADLLTVEVTQPAHAAEAKKLSEAIEKEEAEGRRSMQAAIQRAVADDVDGRKAYARQAEDRFLRGGFDITVTASGPKATILTLKYVLFSRPAVYNLVNTDGHESDFISACRKLGFTKVVFTDGFDKTWTIPLAGRR